MVAVRPHSEPLRPLLLPERIRDRRHSRRLVLGAAAFAVAVLLSLVILVGLTALKWHNQALERGEADARNLALAVSDSIARTVQSVDAALQLAAQPLAEPHGEGASRDVEARLRSVLAFAPHLRQLVITAPDGAVLFDSLGRLHGQRLDVSPYLDRLRAFGTQLVIGPVQFGRFLGQSDSGGHKLIPMGRVMLDQAGQPVAIVIAAVNQQYIQSSFAALEAGEGGRVALYLHDGTMLAATSGGDTEFTAQAHHGDALFRRLDIAEFGQFTTDQPDGISRITAYRMTHLWPLVVTVGLSVDTISAKWRDDAGSMALPVLALGTILMVMAAVLVRVLMVQAQEEEALTVASRALMGVGEAVIITDEHARIVYANPAFERISGHNLAAVIGQNPRFLHGADRDQPDLDHVRAAIAEHRDAAVVLRNYRANGDLYWVELAISPVRNESGHVTHFVGVQRDIDRQKRDEAEKQRLVEELLDTSTKLQRFTYVASHEILQPIVSVEGFAGFLAMKLGATLTGEAAEALAEICSSATRAHRMINGLREYFQLSVSDEPFTVIDTGHMVKSILTEFAEPISTSRAAISVAALPKIHGNTNHILLVWRNLIENALKFRQPGLSPVIVIAAELAEGWVHFSVGDNGLGIPPQRYDEIFDLMRRLNGSCYPGLGMGLPACHTIVARHGGRIWVTPGAMAGSIFHFTLPLAADGESAP